MADATHDPVAILEEMMRRKPEDGTYRYRKSRDFWDVEDNAADEAELKQLYDEFSREYRAVAGKLEAAWGKPEFSGDYEGKNYPGWNEGMEVTYWRHGDQIAYVWWEHPDREFAIAVVLGVLSAKRAEQLDAEYRKALGLD